MIRTDTLRVGNVATAARHQHTQAGRRPAIKGQWRVKPIKVKAQLGFVAGAALFAATLASAHAAPVIIDFEAAGFTPGESVDNHQPDGTEAAPPITNVNQAPQAFYVPRSRTATPPPDEEIVDLSGSANATDAAHGKVWRLSNGAETGTLGGAPQSPHMNGVAGQSGALNDAGRGAPTTNTFFASLDIRSATGAAQTGLGLSITGAAFDQRHGFVRVLDDGDGLDLQFFDTIGTAFNGVLIAEDLSYTEWFNLAIEVIFVDGFASGDFGDVNAVGNDIVNIYLDGSLVHTGTSWETVYATAGHAESIDQLNFARSGTGGNASSIPAHLGGGLYYDNIYIDNVNPFAANVSEPATLALLGLALAGLGAMRRRLR